jgi:hypothetical protein
LCGASCHPGPGVTFLPGYNCGNEVLAAWNTLLSGATPAPWADAASAERQYRAAAAS